MKDDLFDIFFLVRYMVRLVTRAAWSAKGW
jgi:hypothetical protein